MWEILGFQCALGPFNTWSSKPWCSAYQNSPDSFTRGHYVSPQEWTNKGLNPLLPLWESCMNLQNIKIKIIDKIRLKKGHQLNKHWAYCIHKADLTPSNDLNSSSWILHAISRWYIFQKDILSPKKRFREHPCKKWFKVIPNRFLFLVPECM